MKTQGMLMAEKDGRCTPHASATKTNVHHLMKVVSVVFLLALLSSAAVAAPVLCVAGDTQWTGDGNWPTKKAKQGDKTGWWKTVPDNNTNACIASKTVTLLFGPGKPKIGQTKDLRLIGGTSIIVPVLPDGSTTTLEVSGADIQNDGKILLVGSGSNLVLKNNNVTLSGMGTVTMGDGSEFQLDTNLLNQSTIQGAGTIKNGTKLDNKGKIVANKNNKTLEITVKDLTNSGTMQAVAGGTLRLSSAGDVTNSGTIEALATSSVTGSVKLTNNGNLTANGGTVDLILQGTNNGKIAAIKGGTVKLTLSGAFTNSGLGTIETEDQNSSLTIDTTAKPYNMTNDGTILIRPNTTAQFLGTGKINNNGVIRVQDQGKLTGSNLVNTNKVNAAKGATVALSDGYLQTDGSTLADGSIAAPQIDIQGGLLAGTGQLSGNVMMSGTLNPGDPGVAGTLTINGNYVEDGSGILHELLQDYSSFGKTIISGADTLDGTLHIDLAPSLALQLELGDKFEIMDASSVSGEFSKVLGASIRYGVGFDVLYNTSAGCEYGPACVVLEVVATPTPEPGSLFLFGSGVIGLSAFLRKRLHKTA